MSSTIEFRHLAIALPSALALAAVRTVAPDADAFYDWGCDGHQYLVFAEAGDSRVFDGWGSRGRISRRWHLAAVGSRYLVLRTVARVAADGVLSGGVCLRTRERWTRPETYIATYREAMDRSIAYADAAGRAPDLALRLNLSQSPGYQEAWNARDACRDHLRAQGRLEGEGEGRSVSLAPLRSPEGLADLAWLSTLGRDDGPPGWLDNVHKVNEAIDGLAEWAKRRAIPDRVRA